MINIKKIKKREERKKLKRKYFRAKQSLRRSTLENPNLKPKLETES